MQSRRVEIRIRSRPPNLSLSLRKLFPAIIIWVLPPPGWIGTRGISGQGCQVRRPHLVRDLRPCPVPFRPQASAATPPRLAFAMRASQAARAGAPSRDASRGSLPCQVVVGRRAACRFGARPASLVTTTASRSRATTIDHLLSQLHAACSSI